jgi:hypothetical protein
MFPYYGSVGGMKMEKVYTKDPYFYQQKTF